MKAASSKASIESQLSTRFGNIFKIHERAFAEVISTGLPDVDVFTGGLPRGAITEIYGSDSSGRTGLTLSLLATTTKNGEICALVDTNDVLDPHSAVNGAVDLEKLLWIRCGGNLEHSFKAVDLLLQAGGFGVVVLDLADVQAKEARRIIASWWYRFRRVVENTSTALIVMAQDACARSCASLTLALRSKESLWSRANELEPAMFSAGALLPFKSRDRLKTNSRFVSHGNLFRANSIEVECIKPVHVGSISKSGFSAKSH